VVNDPISGVMNLDLTDEETAALPRELDGLIDGDRYFMSQRIKTLKAIRAKIRPEPVREPLPPPPKTYAPPRANGQAETPSRTLTDENCADPL
jgi:hypothetical protein